MTFTITRDGQTAARGDLRCYHGTWTLRNGWVAPAYRGQGFQRRLIMDRLSYARTARARRVIAWVDPRNAYSLNNLVVCGFRFLKRPMRAFDGVKHVMLEHVIAVRSARPTIRA